MKASQVSSEDLTNGRKLMSMLATRSGLNKFFRVKESAEIAQMQA